MYVIRIRRGGHAAPLPTAARSPSDSFGSSGACSTEISMLSRSQSWRQRSSRPRGSSSLACSFAQQRAFTVPSPRSAPYLVACASFALSASSAGLSGMSVTSFRSVGFSFVVKYLPSWTRWFEQTTI